jgi:hypothetical protein
MTLPANTYLAKSFTWGSTAIEGILDIQNSEGGSVVDLFTDSASHVSNVFIENIGSDVSITTSDLNAIKDFRPGDTGYLTIVYGKRLQGRGIVSTGSDIKFVTNTVSGTQTKAVIVSVGRPGVINGIASQTVSFRLAGSDGASAFWAVSVGTF